MAKKENTVREDDLAVAKIIVMFGLLLFLIGYAASGFSVYFLIGVPAAIIFFSTRRRGGGS